MKFISILFFFLLLAFSTQAQREYDYSDQEEEVKKKRTGYQVIVFELLLDPVKGLEDLPDYEYPTVNDLGYQFHLRYGFGKRKLSPIVDLSYYYRSTAKSLNLSNNANIRSFGLGVGHDFNLVNGDHFFIKPMYLINFVWYKINFTENLTGDKLGDILNSDYKEFTFRSFQVPIQVGLNLGFKFKMDDSDLGLSVGGGYIINYSNANWKVGRDLQVSDSINLSSFYLSAGLISSF